jgi:hypothetical protein
MSHRHFLPKCLNSFVLKRILRLSAPNYAPSYDKCPYNLSYHLTILYATKTCKEQYESTVNQYGQPLCCVTKRVPC